MAPAKPGGALSFTYLTISASFFVKARRHVGAHLTDGIGCSGEAHRSSREVGVLLSLLPVLLVSCRGRACAYAVSLDGNGGERKPLRRLRSDARRPSVAPEKNFWTDVPSLSSTRLTVARRACLSSLRGRCETSPGCRIGAPSKRRARPYSTRRRRRGKTRCPHPSRPGWAKDAPRRCASAPADVLPTSAKRDAVCCSDMPNARFFASCDAPRRAMSSRSDASAYFVCRRPRERSLSSSISKSALSRCNELFVHRGVSLLKGFVPAPSRRLTSGSCRSSHAALANLVKLLERKAVTDFLVVLRRVRGMSLAMPLRSPPSPSESAMSGVITSRSMSAATVDAEGRSVAFFSAASSKRRTTAPSSPPPLSLKACAPLQSEHAA